MASGLIRSAQRISRRPILPRKAAAPGEPLPLVYYRRIRCVAGDGGDGMVSFLRAYRHPFGGPDGGDGGNGGHVFFRASRHVGDLSHIKTVIRAGRGVFGGSKSKHGKSAEHVEVPVPLGTTFRSPSLDPSTSQPTIAELHKENKIFLAARGGAGGHGNKFYLSDTMRKPFKAEVGGRGEEHVVDVHMEVIASAGLVGYPNAGKSSLLRAISRARPKVASYPFTTLRPHVGVVQYEDEVQISVADTPGIIEGAHQDAGLGQAFLTHISHCSLLFFVIDASLGRCREQRDVLLNELRMHSTQLAEKPSAVLLNKRDLVRESEVDRMRGDFDCPTMAISAKTGAGLDEFLVFLRDEVEKRDLFTDR